MVVFAICRQITTSFYLGVFSHLWASEFSKWRNFCAPAWPCRTTVVIGSELQRQIATQFFLVQASLMQLPEWVGVFAAASWREKRAAPPAGQEEGTAASCQQQMREPAKKACLLATDPSHLPSCHALRHHIFTEFAGRWWRSHPSSLDHRQIERVHNKSVLPSCPILGLHCH